MQLGQWKLLDGFPVVEVAEVAFVVDVPAVVVRNVDEVGRPETAVGSVPGRTVMETSDQTPRVRAPQRPSVALDEIVDAQQVAVDAGIPTEKTKTKKKEKRKEMRTKIVQHRWDVV